MLYDGSPLHPQPDSMWDLVDECGITVFGTSAKWIAVQEDRMVCLLLKIKRDFVKIDFTEIITWSMNFNSRNENTRIFSVKSISRKNYTYKNIYLGSIYVSWFLKIVFHSIILGKAKANS